MQYHPHIHNPLVKIKEAKLLNTRHNLIIANGQIITSDVVSCLYNPQTYKYDIVFTGKAYSYAYNNATWMKEPKALNPSDFRIVHDKRELFDQLH